MGEMCNQLTRPTRDINTQDVHTFIEMVKEISQQQKITYELALKSYELMAYERRTNIMIDDGNFTDENMCGIGKTIKEVAEQLHDVADALEEIARKE